MVNKKKLLIVNDDLVDMGLISESLAKHGVDTVIVGKYKDALAELKKFKFDLIITDIDLKEDKNGLDLIKKLRETDKKTKILVATGFGPFYKEQAIDAGANGYFEKPMDFTKHILNPLGIKQKEPSKKTRITHTEEKLTLRSTIHELGNRHNCIVLVSSILAESLKDFIKNEKLSVKVKGTLESTIDDLNDIEVAGKSADDLLKQVRTSVYKNLNPDKIKVEV